MGIDLFDDLADMELLANNNYTTRKCSNENSNSDMEFVKNFTHPDFQAKSFTPQKCVICDSFFAN